MAEDVGRRTAAIAEAVFERIDVLGANDYTFTLTAHAKAGLGRGLRGWRVVSTVATTKPMFAMRQMWR